MPIVDNQGKAIGDLNDVIFDPLNGAIIAFALRDNIVVPVINQKIAVHSRSIIVASGKGDEEHGRKMKKSKGVISDKIKKFPNHLLSNRQRQ